MKNQCDLEFEIRRMILEMNDPRHDGYVTSGIREELKKIKGIIEIALEEYNPCIPVQFTNIKIDE